MLTSPRSASCSWPVKPEVMRELEMSLVRWPKGSKVRSSVNVPVASVTSVVEVREPPAQVSIDWVRTRIGRLSKTARSSAT
jgi:hypothetical protein